MKYGFLGLGNMAGAIIRGMYRSGRFTDSEILGFNRSPGKTQALKEECSLVPCSGLCELAEHSDVLILAVKPQVLPELMPELAESLKPGTPVLSIAAGKKLDWYEQRLPTGTPVIRIMPNINARVGRAVTSICGNTNVKPEHLETAKAIFSAIGKVYEVREDMFSAFSAIGGASGAFICLYIDALAEAGVKAGFPRPLAAELACETVLGTAELVSRSGEHPIALMDQICSPGGTTIEGVLKLKELAFESAVQQGIQAIIDKDKRL